MIQVIFGLCTNLLKSPEWRITFDIKMQTGSRAPAPDNPSMSKPQIFGIISVLVVTILAVPIVLPHITHPSMIFHITVHIISVIIAIFLSIISLLAYQRRASTRVLLMTIGFLSLAAIEFIYLLSASDSFFLPTIPNVNIELPHILLLAMLALFGAGVLKVNN